MGFDIYYTGYVTKNLSVMMINRIDSFIEEKDGGKYLSIASADRISEVLKKYSKVWSGIKYYIEKVNDSELGEYED